MTARIVVLAALALLLWAGLNSSITLPLLSVVGLVAWAVFATFLAAKAAHRGAQERPDRKERYR